MCCSKIRNRITSSSIFFFRHLKWRLFSSSAIINSKIIVYQSKYNIFSQYKLLHVSETCSYLECEDMLCFDCRCLSFKFTNIKGSVDKKNQLDVTFCILYFSSNSCSTCFGQPCAHHQEMTTA